MAQIKELETYRFYTKTEIHNRQRDRRFRRGLPSMETIPAGTQVRVEGRQWIDDEGKSLIDIVKTYYIAGDCVRDDAMADELLLQDPGHDDAARSIEDAAARCHARPEWFAYAVVEELVKDGRITLEEAQALYNR